MDDQEVKDRVERLVNQLDASLALASATKGARLATSELLRSLAKAGLLLRGQGAPLDLEQLRALEGETTIPATRSKRSTLRSWIKSNLQPWTRNLVSMSGLSKTK